LPHSKTSPDFDCYRRIHLPPLTPPVVSLSFPCPGTSNTIIVTFDAPVVFSSVPTWIVQGTPPGTPATVVSWSTTDTQTYTITLSETLTSPITVQVQFGDQSIKTSAGLTVMNATYECYMSPQPPPPPPPPPGPPVSPCCSSTTLPSTMFAALTFTGPPAAWNGVYPITFQASPGGWVYLRSSQPTGIIIITLQCMNGVWNFSVDGFVDGVEYAGFTQLTTVSCQPVSFSGNMTLRPPGTGEISVSS
jgi:Bacterial Ig-like domain